MCFSGIRKGFIAAFFSLGLFLFFPLWVEGKNPEAVYLTWKDDPKSSMVVQWIELGEIEGGEIRWKKEGEEEWKRGEATASRLKNLSCFVLRVELSSLEPGSTYLFQVGKEVTTYQFQTLSEEKPLVFAVGGDAFYDGVLFRKMNEAIALQNPDFVVVGGDVAYTLKSIKGVFHGADWEVKRWIRFLAEWQRDLSGVGGRLIPIVPVVGNHDIQGGEAPLQDELFYQLFTFSLPDKLYRVMDMGLCSLFLLDTGHHSSVGGEQALWLEEELKKRDGMKLAIYHIAAFPSHYSWDKKISVKMRSIWTPLFEKYGVYAAFEHHNHLYKRTHPIRDGKIDPAGVVYLGDGSWGVPPRSIKGPLPWYLAKALSINAYFLVKIQKDQILIEPRSSAGQMIEEPLSFKR